MVEIRRILCPTDFSDSSRHALEHAMVIAGWYGSQIVALHVGNPMIVLSLALPVPPFPSGGVPGDTNRQRLEAELWTWLSPATAAGLQTDVVVDEGNPLGRILDHASSLRPDLIVMGTHGQSGFERLLLGSVAEKVIRKARCPVMTVPPPAASTSTLPFKRLLCPLDFSDSSTAALQFAFSLAQESNARLTLLHVFEWPSDEASARQSSRRLNSTGSGRWRRSIGSRHSYQTRCGTGARRSRRWRLGKPISRFCASPRASMRI